MSVQGTGRRRARPVHYLIAGVAVGTAWAASLPLRPLLGEPVPLTLFAIAVVVAAWAGGLGPGLLATLLATGVAHVVSPTDAPVTVSGYAIRMALFAVLGIAISVFSEMRRTARARFEASAETVASEVRARRDAEERYRRIVETAMEGVWEVDAQGRTVYANRRLEEMLGYAPGGMIGMDAFALVAPASVEAARRDWQRRPGADAVPAGEYELLRKDGSTLWVQSTAAPVLDADGAFAGACALMTDATVRRDAERALRAGEARRGTEVAVARVLGGAPPLDDAYPRLLQAITEGLGWDLGVLWLVDGDANALTFASGWRREDVSGDFVSASARATFSPGVGLPGRVWTSAEAAWAAELASDTHFTRRDAAAAAGLVTGFAIPILAGAECVGVIELFSRRPRAPEADLLDAAPALGGQIGHFLHARRGDEERARLLAAEKQARQEAESANRAKDEFLATLSHELRTPLNAIVGWAHLLRTGQLDAAGAQRAMEVIDRNARAQSQIIADVLDASKIVMGKLRLNVASVSLAPVIEGAMEAVRAAADAKGVRIEAAWETRELEVSGDADRLRQTVWNLLSNAVKFTPQGGRVTVQLRRAGPYAEIRVEDTGAGIAADFLPHVFERFRQSDQSSTRRHGGLGLGLALVRQLVELHGGTVSADSKGENMGATFVVRLPLPVPAAAAEPDENAPETTTEPVAHAAETAPGLPRAPTPPDAPGTPPPPPGRLPEN